MYVNKYKPITPKKKQKKQIGHGLSYKGGYTYSDNFINKQSVLALLVNIISWNFITYGLVHYFGDMSVK